MITKIFKGRVRKQDTIGASRFSSSECPFARCIRRTKGFRKVLVGTAFVSLHHDTDELGESDKAEIPERMTRLIIDWDSNVEELHEKAQKEMIGYKFTLRFEKQ